MTRTFWGVMKVFYVYRGSGYTTLYLYQSSWSCTPNKGKFYSSITLKHKNFIKRSDSLKKNSKQGNSLEKFRAKNESLPRRISSESVVWVTTLLGFIPGFCTDTLYGIKSITHLYFCDFCVQFDSDVWRWI